MKIWKNGNEQVNITHGVEMLSNVFVIYVRPKDWICYEFIITANDQEHAIALLKKNAKKAIEAIKEYCPKHQEWALDHKLAKMKEILHKDTKLTAKRIDGDRAIPVSYFDDSRSISSL